MYRILPLLFAAMAAAAIASAQKYTGPPPPKADVLYIQHATNLIATEPVDAKEQKSKDDTVWTIDGENSSARTPLALPIFVVKIDKLIPGNLQMFRLESKDGHRVLTASAKKSADPIHVEVTRLGGGDLYQLGVYNSLDAGEYALVIEGSTHMFCFQVF